MHTPKQSGLSLIEAIIAIALFAVLVSGLVGSLVYGQTSTSLAGTRNRAVFVAEEGLEAVRNISDDDFSNLSDGTYGLAVIANEWNFSGSYDTTDAFTRAITVSSVDTYTKDITSTVTWDQTEERSGSISLVTRLTEWMREVITLGDWSNPSEETTFDLSGNSDGEKIQYNNNYAFVVRNGGSPDFYVIDVSDPANPVVKTSLDLDGTLYNLALAGDYAYIASSENSSELIIIDISDPTSPSEVGSFNASGNADAYGVYAIGTTAYLVRKSSGDDELIVIDASNPASPSELGTQDLGANANEIFVMGDYAYIASDDNSEELQVADISDLESIDIVGTYNASGNSDANTITGFTDRILLGRADGLLFLLDVSTPSSPSSLGSTDVGNATLDLAMGPDNDYVFVACDTNNQEFQVIDITNPPTLQTLSFLGASNDLHGIVYDADHDRAYAVGEDNSEEFVVYMPQ